jgi:hypothetical protein
LYRKAPGRSTEHFGVHLVCWVHSQFCTNVVLYTIYVLFEMRTNVKINQLFFEN